MDQFSQPVLSKKLLTIIANSTTSTNQIIFKRAIASSDKYKLDDLSGFDDTSISTIKKASETVFSNVTIDGNGIQLTAIFSSNGNDSNYDINTILFTAEYGGQEFLAFSQIANYSLTVPAGSSKEVFNLTLKPKIIIDSVKNISTTVNPSGVATNEYVDSHDSELKKMIDEGTSDRKNIWTKFSDYILKSGNPQTIDTKLTFTEKINGTATKSDALATARTINGTNFDGTANISIKASNDSDLVHKSSAETISGDKNFTGKLQKNGVDVATTSDVASAQNSATNTAKSYTDSSINSIDVGGRNLLEDTNSKTNSWLNTINATFSISYPDLGNGEVAYQFDVTKASNDWMVFNHPLKKAKIQPDTDYVLTFKANFSTDIKLELRFANGGAGNNLLDKADTPTVVSSNGDQLVTIHAHSKKILPDASDQKLYINGFVNKTGSFKIWDLMLEEGNLASSYQPAPEDKLDANANAASATKLATPRKIGGVAFDGTADINLPGVNTTGNQNTTGFAAGITANSIPNGTNLNDFRTTGNYDIRGVTLANAPETYQWGLLEIQAIVNGSNGVQRITDTNTGTVYTRTWNMTNGSYNFTDWKQGGGGVKVLSEADISTPTYASSSYPNDRLKYTPTFSNMHIYATSNTLRLTGNLSVTGTYWNAVGNKMGYLIDTSPLLTSNTPQVALNGVLWGKRNIVSTTTLVTTEVSQSLSNKVWVDYISFNGKYFYYHVQATDSFYSGTWYSGNIPIDITVTYS